jgi:NSS family neurotransmitter:Na+ symporter
MTNNLEPEHREEFSSRLGAVAAAAGSAVGLGNIWMFPYIAGKNGGGAFLFVYIICVLLIGLPIMLSEFILGRKGRRNVVGAFKKLAPGTPWHLGGWFSIIACFLILSFYGIVAGWCISYLVKSAANAFSGASAEQLTTMFQQHRAGAFEPAVWHLIFIGLTAGIVISGVKSGIEKFSKFVMPLLFVIVLILAVRSLTLPGAGEGLDFLFNPQWSKMTPQVILIALGTAFFSLGIGNGVMVTYGSYISKKSELGKTALQVSLTDTAAAVLAGIAIFPAVFAFGLKAGSGPGLVFETLPNIFQQLPGGYVFGVLFFFLLVVAALTSSIATMEVIVAFLTEEFKFSRQKATVLTAAIITIIGIPCALSWGVLADFTLFDKSYFDFIVWLVEAVFLPVGGLLIALFVGWRLSTGGVGKELSEGGAKASYKAIYLAIIKFLVPLAIAIIFLNGLGILTF